jgi:hypothetical protein
MPRTTPRLPGVKLTSYTTRNLRVDLLDRVRVLAAVQRTTIEHVMNEVLEAGLVQLEAKLASSLPGR